MDSEIKLQLRELANGIIDVLDENHILIVENTRLKKIEQDYIDFVNDQFNASEETQRGWFKAFASGKIMIKD